MKLFKTIQSLKKLHKEMEKQLKWNKKIVATFDYKSSKHKCAMSKAQMLEKLLKL